MSKRRFLSCAELDRAALAVQDELGALGLWKRVSPAEIFWCALPQWPPLAMGYFIHSAHPLEEFFGWRAGHIYLPAFSVSPRNPLDVLRHEYGHAFAHYRPAVQRSRAFRAAFGGDYWREDSSLSQRRRDCVSSYATESPREDFAETFMVYVRRQGREPLRMTAGLRRKWEFVAHL